MFLRPLSIQNWCNIKYSLLTYYFHFHFLDTTQTNRTSKVWIGKQGNCCCCLKNIVAVGKILLLLLRTREPSSPPSSSFCESTHARKGSGGSNRSGKPLSTHHTNHKRVPVMMIIAMIIPFVLLAPCNTWPRQFQFVFTLCGISPYTSVCLASDQTNSDQLHIKHKSNNHTQYHDCDDKEQNQTIWQFWRLVQCCRQWLVWTVNIEHRKAFVIRIIVVIRIMIMMIGIIMIRKMKMIRNNYDHDYDAVQEHIWYLRKALNSVNASPIV